MTFAKYEGAGNDFILIDNREGIFTPDAETIARLCDRHFGIGADGLMTLSRSAEMDCSMRYYNADGSEGEMCGNGARCFRSSPSTSASGAKRNTSMRPTGCTRHGSDAPGGSRARSRWA